MGKKIIIVSYARDKTRHIKDDSGRLHWDLLCANRLNKAASWSTGEISEVNCSRCLGIFNEQNEVLREQGLKRSDAGLLFAGLSDQGNIQRDRIQHLIDGGIFTGNPGVVGWWANGVWLTKQADDAWCRCELTERGNKIAERIWGVRDERQAIIDDSSRTMADCLAGKYGRYDEPHIYADNAIVDLVILLSKYAELTPKQTVQIEKILSDFDKLEKWYA